MQADKRDMTGWYKLPNLELRLSAIMCLTGNRGDICSFL